MKVNDSIKNLYKVIADRKNNPMEGSYTCYLFDEGLNKILKKCGEECSEVIIASKDDDPESLKNEICDLLYHLVVLMVDRGIRLDEIDDILEERRQKIKNRKVPHKCDKNS